MPTMDPSRRRGKAYAGARSESGRSLPSVWVRLCPGAELEHDGGTIAPRGWNAILWPRRGAQDTGRAVAAGGSFPLCPASQHSRGDAR